MVLGVLCLFTIVLSYQFLPRKRSAAPHVNKFTSKQPEKPSLLRRLRTQCTTFLPFFSNYRRKRPATTSHAAISTGEGRRLRPLYLPEDKKRKREMMKQKFATTLRINVNVPDLVKNPFAPSRPPLRPTRNKRYGVYVPHTESEYTHLTQPEEAVLSPWSVREEEYPYADYEPETRRPLYFYSNGQNSLITPPPLSTPKPVFVADSPLRSAGKAQFDVYQDASDRWEGTEWEKTNSLISVVDVMLKQQVQFAGDVAGSNVGGVFVIGDEPEEDDWDTRTSSSAAAESGQGL
ncbi:hypothetical protein K474DRAFT_1662607, partial [Panus rudis PR-1116 ss-1]